MVIDQYCEYIQNNYGSCIVVFDGYGNGASTKDHEHRRRNKGMAFPYVKIELDTHTISKMIFYRIDLIIVNLYQFLETAFKRKALLFIKALTMQIH